MNEWTLSLILPLLRAGADRFTAHMKSRSFRPRDRVRGRYFFDSARAKARRMGLEFNWRLKTVHGVGHNYRGISLAAAGLLYGSYQD